MKILTLVILALFWGLTCRADEAGKFRNESNNRSTANRSVGAQPAEDLAIVRSLAKQREIVLDGWENGTYIDLSKDGSPLIIQETTASNTKCLSITPVVNFDKHSLTIDCSYVRAHDGEVLSVGTYCRGETESSADNIEDGTDDQHMFVYSTSISWLGQANRVALCPSPRGLRYFDLYVVRCDLSESYETTDDVTIFFLDEAYRVKLRVHGYEFAPKRSDSKPKHAEFWGIRRNSPYEIIEKDL